MSSHKTRGSEKNEAYLLFGTHHGGFRCIHDAGRGGADTKAPPQDTKGAAAAGDAAKGKEVFEQCGVCHNTDTDEKKIGPSLKGLFKHDKLKNGKKVTEANVRELIDDGGNGMPAYADMLSKKKRTTSSRT